MGLVESNEISSGIQERKVGAVNRSEYICKRVLASDPLYKIQRANNNQALKILAKSYNQRHRTLVTTPDEAKVYSFL